VPGTTSPYTLRAGDVLDRVGAADGSYLSPIGTQFERRALQPGAAAEPYKQYEVVKPFTVERSVIEPAFNESGLGVQYKIPEVSGRKAKVQDLIDNGYLKEKR
jgi:filamentous hemagglutinin